MAKVWSDHFNCVSHILFINPAALCPCLFSFDR